MNSNFNDEQIRAYAEAFEEGDAIWCDGKWLKVSKSTKMQGASFKEEETLYRVTTLTDYKLKGWEKLVWLGDVEHFTFGAVYEVKYRPEYDVNVFVYDNDGYVRTPKSKNWAVIPKYEQVQSIERKETKTSDVANILYKRYYDVLQNALHNNIKSALEEKNYGLVIELSELAIEMKEESK